MYITKKDIITIVFFAVLLLLFSLFEDILGFGFVSTLICSSVLLLLVIFEVYRRILGHMERLSESDNCSRENYFQQVEALLSIYATLDVAHVLPSTRNWAASPDLLKKIMETTLKEKPKLVLEASSGVSTLIIGYCLKKIGAGKVISLENDAKYAEISADMVKRHGLSDIVQVVHTPLVEVMIKGEKWLWYDVDNIKMDQKVDLFVIDGPPASTQNLARYPALPLLFDSIADNATIILDDGARKAETEIARRWESDFDGIVCDYLNLEKGVFVIKKNKKPI